MKIGFRAADLVSNNRLRKFLQANQSSLGDSNEKLQEDSGAKFTHDFVPLADVADIIWRTTRPTDESNHFCDIDEADPTIYGGKTLLELSLESDRNIDVDVWLDFDRQMDAKHPITKTLKDGKVLPRPREGALPFRVWQMYKQMITSLKAGKLDEFLVAGGTMAHYGGDACQPLHISKLHHGENTSEGDVHSDYETGMVDRYRDELFEGVDRFVERVGPGNLIGPDGLDAARSTLSLMNSTVTRLPPERVVEVWRESRGPKKLATMWAELKDETIKNIADGCFHMAVLWESAWVHGDGDSIPEDALKKISESRLQELYNDKSFVKSYRLSDAAGYKSVL